MIHTARAACCFLIALTASAAPFQASVARIDLTPPLEMKAALGGYGARMSKPATGIHDGVWAKALVMTQGDRRFALVTADVLAFPPWFKAAVCDRLTADGWAPDQLLLLASHSHTSLDMMALHPSNSFGIPQVGVFQKELFDLTATRLAQVVRDGARSPVPVLASSITIQVPERNRNRRHGGPVHDTDLTVTRVDTAAGAPLAVLVNWTAHPTFMSEEDMLFSGDWPGHLQRTIEALIGQGVTVMYYNGAEGDQSPVPPAQASSAWERAERYGREMGILAWRAWDQLRPHDVQVFSYHTETIVLPKHKAHPDFMKTGGAEYGLNDAMMQQFIEHLVPSQTHSTALRVGDLLILGVPGELAAGLGMQAKAKVKAATHVPCVTVGGLADEWVSYILPVEEYRRGGYEASMSLYGETLSETIVDGVVRSGTAQ